MKQISNYAFIDGQNLHLGTTNNGWRIDHYKFRVYLRDKYSITEAYYVFGYVSESQQDLYSNLQKAGFIVLFKEHNPALKGKKKGNVDTDVVFEMMKILLDDQNVGNFLLVSGDGDYKKLVSYLIEKNKFEKILFPNKKFASSLYRRLGTEYYDFLENPSIKAKIEFK